MRKRMERIAFDWNLVRALLATAEHGSYTAAAAALGTTQPTVGRQIAALEAHFDVALVERAGRGVELTPAALELIEHARAMAEGARRLALAAEGHTLALEGVVTISASEVISVHLLPPVLDSLCADYPLLRIDVVATSELSDLRRREADIAIRNVRPEDPELIAVRLPDRRAWLYGSAAYLDHIGRPRAGDDVSHVTICGFERSARLREVLASLGVIIADAQVRVASESMLLQWELARRGHALAVMMEEVGDADPTMERALPGMAPFPVPMWLAAHRGVHTSQRVRVVFDRLRAALT